MSAGQLCVCLLWTLVTQTPAQSPPCVSLVMGVLYGSFSVRDVFPTLSVGCSWTLENPDPTKFSLYLRFSWSTRSCLSISPMVVALDHYLSNETCTLVEQHHLEARELCPSAEHHAFFQFDKNFVQLCLAAEPALGVKNIPEEVLDSPLVEVLLINNENSSLFTCAVLCHWLEECMSSHTGSASCGDTQNDCVCPEMALPIPLLPIMEDGHSSNILFSQPDECCVTQLVSHSAVTVSPRDGGESPADEDQDVKMQTARSVGSQGFFQAQTGDPAGEVWSLWGGCSATCGPGWQVRTRSCVQTPHSTMCSGPLRESRPCYPNVTCPVHGLWEEWTPWSLCSVTCGRGSRIRTRSCTTPQHGGKACGGPEEQSKVCNIAACPASGIWGPWSSWSDCSQTCGSGSQQRVRECQGDSCHGSEDETRLCGEEQCPADHEMCQNEFRDSISWKKTAAGETVFAKCPSDAIGSASRRCLLDARGVASWAPPSFARCISLEYRYLHLSLREHLAKGQRALAAEGMSQILRNLHQLLSHRSYYSGDLLFSVEILRNVTDTFRRAAYVPAADNVQKFFQVVSYMFDTENQERWEDIYQVSMASEQLLQVVDDFIHLLGEAQRVFHTSLIVTDNLVVTIQREPVSAISSDIHFPMKGRRGMKDWARSSQDKIFIPKEVFKLASEESEDSSSFVIGVVLYRTLGFILPALQSPLLITSKVLTVTVRPPTKPMGHLVVLEFQPLLNGTVEPSCAVWDYGNTEGGPENWDTQSCQTLPSTVHTKCLCSKLSTFAVLAQWPKDEEMKLPSFPSLPVLVGTVVSCAVLFILLFIYFIFWRYIRSERSIILVNFCLSILASNVLILAGQSHALGKGLCMVTAALLHFFFLSSFCWVLTEAWHSYLAVAGGTRTRLLRKRFLCLGWGLPALVVAVSIGFTRTKGYGTSAYCWLSLEGGLLYAFVGPAALIVLVNMLIGIIIFNKLMARDGVSDAHKKQRAGASLWSSCVVLPLLALTWMSAVLAITDRRSALFQVLFGVFDGVQSMVILMVHGVLRREVQDAARGRPNFCKDSSEHSGGSCRNGQAQVDFEKGVDLASQTAVFKEVDTSDPATVTSTMSRVSVNEKKRLTLPAPEGGIGFSRLPGSTLPPGLVQLPPLGSLGELREHPLREVKVEQLHQQEAPVYLCTDSELGWAQPPEPQVGYEGDGDYMNLPPRTLGEQGQQASKVMAEPPCLPPRLGSREAYHSLLSLDHISLTLSESHGMQKNVLDHVQSRHAGRGHTHRTLPRRLGSTSTSHSAGSLERVMHNRKRQQELHQGFHHTKFPAIDGFQQNVASSAFRTEKRLSVSSAGGESDSSSGKSTPNDQHSWDGFQTATLDPLSNLEKQEDEVEQQNQDCDTHAAHTPDTSDEDYQTEV